MTDESGLREIKTDKMCKLKREIEILEWGMQRMRTKLHRLQQDLMQMPSTSKASILPRQLLGQDYYDQHDKDQDRVQMRCEYDEHDMSVDPYSTREQKIRADAVLSR